LNPAIACPFACARNASACSTIHAVPGLNVQGESHTQRVLTWMNASTKHWRTPSGVMMCFVKKSHCHRLAAWAFRKPAHVPFVASVRGSRSFSRRMFTTFERDVFYAQLLQLPEDAGVAPVVLPRQPQDQVSHLLAGPGPAGLAAGSGGAGAGQCRVDLAHVPPVGRVGDDGQQRPHRGPANALCEPDQQTLLFGVQAHVPDPPAEHQVLGAEELDLFGQLALGAVGDEQQQGLVEPPHARSMP
jgi:hypothetical protein